MGALLLLAITLAACSPPGQEQLTRSATSTAPPPATVPDPTAAPTPTDPTPKASTSTLSDYEIVTLLPRDAIPAILDPEFLTVEEANQEYEDDELVLGVEINGEARAYSIPHLSLREIVNDTVGGRRIAATW